MSAGYGRGYYGGDQLQPSRRSRGGWVKLALVVGVGAVIWRMLPGGGTKSEPGPGRGGEEPPPAPPSAPDEGLDQLARSRGFSSTNAYEDSVIANARELRASGAKVVLAPQLAHLESRL
jgi:hypothetical protein